MDRSRAPFCDHAFNDDWSLTWRVVAGGRQGQVGRAREFVVRPLRDELFLLSFVATPGASMIVAVDFATLRVTGAQAGSGHCLPLSGTFRTM